MINLHAAWADGGLLLWGEKAPVEELRPIRRRGRKPKIPRPRAHPFAATPLELCAAATAACSGLGLIAEQAVSHLAWLPTAGDVPLPSSSLVAAPTVTTGAPVLAPWSVMGLPLLAAQQVTLLTACADRATLAPGVLVGRDLRFWSEAMRLAGALAVRQRFLPGVARQQGRWRACWEPVFLHADAERLERLAAAMPGACRALTHPDAGAPPEEPATQSLTAFVAQMLDHLVRTGHSEGTGAIATQTRRVGRNGLRDDADNDSLHDRWTAALVSPDGWLTRGEAELAALADQVRAWQRPLAALRAAPFRFCFRLEEPAEDVGNFELAPDEDAEEIEPATDAAWTVQYLLQAVSDPSLLIPVPDAWAGKVPQVGSSSWVDGQAREFILAGLGQAAGLCPHVGASLKGGVPAGYPLDTAGAYAFLTETAPALQQAGFGVMLPAWWTGQGTRNPLTARARVKSPTLQSNQGLSLADIVQVQWQVALGDQPLSLAEVERLAKLKAPLVRLRGRWVQVDAAALQEAARLLRQRKAAALTVRDVVQMALGAGGADGSLPVGEVTGDGPLRDLLAGLRPDGPDGALDELDPPQGLMATLRPYQVRGYSWLAFLSRWGLGACLADDMGLGKTVQSLALIQRNWQAGSRGPVLLICPTSVVHNWQREAARFTPDLPVMVQHGADRLRGEVFTEAAAQAALVLTTYALVHRDSEQLGEVPWAGIILDEAQHIKNPETKQARAVRRLRADFRIALTGTPVENHVGDLWSLMQFLNPGLLGSQTEFRRRYFVPIQVQRDGQATARLKRITGPFILRRLKTDRTVIRDLPDKIETKVACNLTPEQASLYRAVVREAEAALDPAQGMERRGLVLATLAKLKQVCNHPAHFLRDRSPLPGRSGKLARLTELCDELLAVGDRALLFTQFTEMGELLCRYLQETFGQEALFLHGGVPRSQRDRLVERFQNEDGPPFFVLSLKAGGTGLNLTRANHVFHFDRWWNPAVENQATDRAFRIGQTQNVQVHKFLCAGTLEEKIDAMIERKRELAGEIVGSGEAWLTELSTADLKELFALEKSAVAVEG